MMFTDGCKKILFSFVLFVAMSLPSVSFAYSYAAAGKEPLIDGREVILQALQANDYSAVETAVLGLKEEFDYLLSDHNVDLLTPINAAIENEDGVKIEAVIDHAVVEEIVRRLEGAQNNLEDYQVAKVLVVKSKLFLDLILPKLTGAQREQANLAIQGVLESIGNPGVFGVGQAPANQEQFKTEQAKLLSAIQGVRQH